MNFNFLNEKINNLIEITNQLENKSIFHNKISLISEVKLLENLSNFRKNCIALIGKPGSGTNDLFNHLFVAQPIYQSTYPYNIEIDQINFTNTSSTNLTDDQSEKWPSLHYGLLENKLLLLNTPFYNYSDLQDQQIIEMCKNVNVFLLVSNAVGDIGCQDEEFFNLLNQKTFVSEIMFIFTNMDNVTVAGRQKIVRHCNLRAQQLVDKMNYKEQREISIIFINNNNEDKLLLKNWILENYSQKNSIEEKKIKITESIISFLKSLKTDIKNEISCKKMIAIMEQTNISQESLINETNNVESNLDGFRENINKYNNDITKGYSKYFCFCLCYLKKHTNLYNCLNAGDEILKIIEQNNSNSLDNSYQNQHNINENTNSNKQCQHNTWLYYLSCFLPSVCLKENKIENKYEEQISENVIHQIKQYEKRFIVDSNYKYHEIIIKMIKELQLLHKLNFKTENITDVRILKDEYNKLFQYIQSNNIDIVENGVKSLLILMELFIGLTLVNIQSKYICQSMICQQNINCLQTLFETFQYTNKYKSKLKENSNEETQIVIMSKADPVEEQLLKIEKIVDELIYHFTN